MEPSRQRPVFPLVTALFLTIVAVMFAIQRYLGPESLPVLVRLGALQPELLAAGEYWRLLTAGVLHGGYSHAGFTAFVLLALGANLERLIGSDRFALLLFFSIAGGFIASAWLLQSTLTVGASGGLWGLLGAYAVLAFSPLVHLPADMKAQLRKSTIINVGINASVSFLPYVDWAAHLGGFVFGGVLFLLVLRHGVPDYENLDEDEFPRPRATSRALRLTSFASWIAFGSALAIVFVHDRPFAFDASYEPLSLEVPQLRATLEVPAQLPLDVSEGGASFGNILKQPAVCTVRRAGLSGVVSDATLAKMGKQHAVQLGKPPENARAVGNFRVERRNGRNIASALYSFPTGLRMQRAFATTRHADFSVECLSWPEFSAYADAAARITASIESRPTPPPVALSRPASEPLSIPAFVSEPVQIGKRAWATGMQVLQRSRTLSLMNMLAEPAKTQDDATVKLASVQRMYFSEREEQILVAEDGIPKRIEVRFGSVGQVLDASGRERQETSESFAGKTYIVNRTDTGLSVQSGDGDAVDSALTLQVARASLLLRGVDPLERLLAGRALVPGEIIKLTREQAARYADIHNASRAVVDIELTYAGTYNRSGERLAVFNVVWRQQQASGAGFSTLFELKGTISVGAADGFTRDMRLEGSADLSGAQVLGLGVVRVLSEANRVR
jgi:rhomboid protease GluP